MKKTFCDGCGTECVNSTVHLSGAIIHSTSRGEQVGYDDMRPAELCTGCFAPIQKALNITVRPQEMGLDSLARSPDRGMQLSTTAVWLKGKAHACKA